MIEYFCSCLHSLKWSRSIGYITSKLISPYGTFDWIIINDLLKSSLVCLYSYWYDEQIELLIDFLIFKYSINRKCSFCLWKKSVKCMITIFDLWQPLSFSIDKTKIEDSRVTFIFLKYYLNSVNMLQALTNWSIV